MFKPWVVKRPRFARVVLIVSYPVICVLVAALGAWEGICDYTDAYRYEWGSINRYIRERRA
jgi:hypothetical protein